MNERDSEHAAALGKCWHYIKSDGSFTTKELKEFVDNMDSSLCRQVLRSLIFTVWTDYGGKEQKE